MREIANYRVKAKILLKHWRRQSCSKLNLPKNLEHKLRRQYLSFQNVLKRIPEEEKAKREKFVGQILKSSTTVIQNSENQMTTSRLAEKVRDKRCYEQDNFLSAYSKAMLTVKDLASVLGQKQILAMIAIHLEY
jgi:hypothetical protein